MTRVSFEQAVLGLGLLLGGLAGIPAGVFVGGDHFAPSLLFFTLGVGASLFARRHKGLDLRTLSALDYAPRNCRLESNASIMARITLIAAAAVGILVVVARVGAGAASPLGGLLVGYSLNELYLALLFIRWEKQARQILVSKSTRLFPYSRAAFPDLFKLERD